MPKEDSAQITYLLDVLILGVKKAFNSAPWPRIKDALSRYSVPGYLQKITGDYLSGRSINATLPVKGIQSFAVSCGVLQGSVLGPDLWNIFYDGLLNEDSHAYGC